MHQFRRCVARYRGNFRVRSFTCHDQYLCMAFAQLTYRESLRDIECCLRAVDRKLYHCGFRGTVSRSTLANANESRDWRIYRDFAQSLILTARDLYVGDDFGVELQETVYALDVSTIDLCLSVFPWAKFRKTKAAVKLHTLLDLRGNIPTFVDITDGKVHDVNVLDILIPEVGAIYVMDRGYLDFERLYALNQAPAFFITRSKSNTKVRRVYSRPVDKACGLRCDQSVVLTTDYSSKRYPEKLRRIRYYDDQQQRALVFLTNNFTLPALTIADLYRCRWQVELFFKWIKQHLRIKAFYGTDEKFVVAYPKRKAIIRPCNTISARRMKRSTENEKGLHCCHFAARRRRRGVLVLRPPAGRSDPARAGATPRYPGHVRGGEPEGEPG